MSTPLCFALHRAAIHAVRRGGERLTVETDAGTWQAWIVISATGTRS
ncbi:hypothetical protein AB0C28_52520 [Nonomuraea sp. NPDC048892]